MQNTGFELVTQYGVMGSLLAGLMYWLVRLYLPEHERLHRTELERLIAAHEQTTRRIAKALERNTCVVQLLSQSLLVQTLAERGMERDEAESVVERIRLSTVGNRPADDAE